MEGISIINRDVNFNPNTVQRINSEKNLFTGDKSLWQTINDPFVKLRSSDKSISSYSDLRESTELVKKEKLAKKRILTKQENGGFVLMGSLTVMGIVGIGAIIFMVIKNFVIR